MKSRTGTETRIRIEMFSGPNTTLPIYGNPPHGFLHVRDLAHTRIREVDFPKIGRVVFGPENISILIPVSVPVRLLI